MSIDETDDNTNDEKNSQRTVESIEKTTYRKDDNSTLGADVKLPLERKTKQTGATYNKIIDEGAFSLETDDKATDGTILKITVRTDDQITDETDGKTTAETNEKESDETAEKTIDGADYKTTNGKTTD